MSVARLEPSEWLRLHVESLFSMDESGDFSLTPTSEEARGPRLFIGRTTDGHRCWFRADVPPTVRARLAESCVGWHGHDGPAPAEVVDACREILAESGSVERVWTGPSYRFPDAVVGGTDAVPITEVTAELLRPYLVGWIDDVQECQPFMAVTEGGHAVSICATVRTSDLADQAGVETHPQFRGRGYAAEAVAGWAKAVRAEGRHPLYSTSWDNAASRAVASKLNLVPITSDLHLT